MYIAELKRYIAQSETCLNSATLYRDWNHSFYLSEPHETKLPETWENVDYQVHLVLNLIGEESGASFLDQSQCEVKHKRSTNGYFRHLKDKCSYSTMFRR